MSIVICRNGKLAHDSQVMYGKEAFQGELFTGSGMKSFKTDYFYFAKVGRIPNKNEQFLITEIFDTHLKPHIVFLENRSKIGELDASEGFHHEFSDENASLLKNSIFLTRHATVVFSQMCLCNNIKCTFYPNNYTGNIIFGYSAEETIMRVGWVAGLSAKEIVQFSAENSIYIGGEIHEFCSSKLKPLASFKVKRAKLSRPTKKKEKAQ